MSTKTKRLTASAAPAVGAVALTTQGRGRGGEAIQAGLDVTKNDYKLITIKSPKGGVRYFRVKTQGRGQFAAGSRMIEVSEDGREWIGFAFASEFGVSVWTRLRENGASRFEKYAKMLEESLAYRAKGCQYTVLKGD
jgi:hypothetical protein